MEVASAILWGRVRLNSEDYYYGLFIIANVEALQRSNKRFVPAVCCGM